MRSEFEKAFKKEYPHADYLAVLKFDEVNNGYMPIKEVDPPDVNFWVCVGVNASWWAFQHQQSKVDKMQKRVDAVKALIKEYRDPATEDKAFQHALSIVAYELEQALKGGGQ